MQSKPARPAVPELRTTLTNIDDQLQSPLFDGTIPPEIRDSIFAFALTDDLDQDKPYSDDTHYTRPGHTHKRKTNISLLLTCRRVYKETYHLPLLMKTHTFFLEQYGRFPPGTICDPLLYFSELPPSQLDFLESVHFFAQQYWLEKDFFALCQREIMKHVVDLKITIRRSDWWMWEDDTPPAITPYAPFPPADERSNDARVMKRMWEEEKQNPRMKRAFKPEYWGSAFQHLPKLKTFTMEFETTKSLEAEMDAVAEHAKGWKFPMGARGILSAEGSAIGKWEWKGTKCMRSQSQRTHRRIMMMPQPLVAGHQARRARRMQRANDGYSDPDPTLVVRVVRWKPVST